MRNLFLFVTANDNEKEAFIKKFKYNRKKHVKGKSYKIGEFGLYNVAYIHIDEQGNENPQSTPIIGELIREINPIGVIMVGIAFGSNKDTQKIGDVIVSKKILSYNAEKIKENKNIYKEDPKEVGFQLFNAFSDDEDWKFCLNEIECSDIHKGAVLTGSKLINDRGFKEKLLEDFERYSPIGGEMEAYGIYSMCRLHGIDEWIIVKGICDWAYDKDVNKQENQRIASTAAVDFCHHVFSYKGIFDDLIKKYNSNFKLDKEFSKSSDNDVRKILILSANPKDTARIRLDKEFSGIKEGLLRQINRKNFLIEYLPSARQDDIRRCMLEFEPNIVHFCGYGSKTEGLVFESDEGFSCLASPQSLASFFELFKESVECVILNACYSKSQAEAISEHIGYVVGMSESINDDVAIEFSVAFYDSIFAGKTYEFAFKMAKNVLQWRDKDKENIPILLKSTGSNLHDSPTLCEYIWKKMILSTFADRNKLGFIMGYETDEDDMKNLISFIHENFTVIFIRPQTVFEYTKYIEKNIEIVDCILYVASHKQNSAWSDYIKKIAQEQRKPFLLICKDALFT